MRETTDILFEGGEFDWGGGGVGGGFISAKHRPRTANFIWLITGCRSSGLLDLITYSD